MLRRNGMRFERNQLVLLGAAQSAFTTAASNKRSLYPSVYAPKTEQDSLPRELLRRVNLP